jgi:hypothetical protein
MVNHLGSCNLTLRLNAPATIIARVKSNEAIHPTLSIRVGITHAACKSKSKVPVIITQYGRFGQANNTPQDGQGTNLRVIAGDRRTLSSHFNL